MWKFIAKIQLSAFVRIKKDFTAGIYPKNPETPVQKNLCTPMIIAALFTIAKCWEQPKCPSVNEWIKNLVHLHNGILHSRKKEGAPTLCYSMDGSGEHYAK